MKEYCMYLRKSRADVEAEAQAFLDYLTSADCDEVFKSVGFSPIEQKSDTDKQTESSKK